MRNEIKASTLNARITGDMRRRLEESARENGRSVSQEVENRLARTFSADPNLGGQRQATLLEDLAAIMNAASMTLAAPWHQKHLGWLIVRDAWHHLMKLLEPPAPSDSETKISPSGQIELERWRNENEPKLRAVLDRTREVEQLKLKRSAFMLDRSEQMRLELLEALPEFRAPSLPNLGQPDLQLWHEAEAERIVGQRLWHSVAPVLSQGEDRLKRQLDEWDEE